MLYRYGTDSNGKFVKKAVIYTEDEHKIKLENIDKDALQIIHRLKEAGFTAYIVGGAVRDLIVGIKTPKDFDIVTDATPSKIKKIFRNSRIIGKRFRLVHVVFGPKIFEVSTFRSNAEGSVGNEFGTIEQDVLRRDFSINALYYDPLTQQVIDYVNGMKDIKKHIIRPVIPMDSIFVEDPVRMLRAIKYSATTNAKMSYALKKKIKYSAVLLASISPSRLTEELLKIINSGFSHQIFQGAVETGLFIYLQPSAASIMASTKEYGINYFKSLEALDALVKNESDCRLGKKLYYLIYDFILSLTDWKKEIEEKTSVNELYLKTWTECRNFILPMNPQRRELEFAIKNVLKDIGVQTKIPQSKKSPQNHKNGEKKARPHKKRAKQPQNNEKSS